MRFAALLLALAACRQEARETTPAPSLDQPPPADAGVVANAEPVLDLAFEDLDGPPASAPTGALVQMKFVPPVVGAKRKRVQLTQAIRRSPQRVQETLTAFVLREEVLAVATNRVKKLAISVETANEVAAIDGMRSEMHLLQGEYTVDISGPYPENMKVTAAVRTIGTREQEELAVIVATDHASATPFHELVWQRPLKLGEAVVLSPAEVKTLLGADGTPAAAITFSLRRLVDGTATYQLDTTLDVGGEHRIVRQRYAVRVATGQLVEIMDATKSTEKLGAETRQQLLIRFE